MHIYISLTYVRDVAKIRDHILIYLPTLDTTLPPCIEPQARMNVCVSTCALEQWAANLPSDKEIQHRRHLQVRAEENLHVPSSE